MTAKDIQRRLCFEHFRQSFILPNYTPGSWFECDLFQVTKAELFVEYEIKISRHDYQADASKAKEKMTWKPADNHAGGQFERTTGPTKHQQLDAAKPPAPNRFYFVFPATLYESEPMHIPAWAGVIIVSRNPSKPNSCHPWHFASDIIKKAPLLHKAKIDPATLHHAKSVCYYRMHNLIKKQS